MPLNTYYRPPSPRPPRPPPNTHTLRTLYTHTVLHAPILTADGRPLRFGAALRSAEAEAAARYTAVRSSLSMCASAT